MYWGVSRIPQELLVCLTHGMDRDHLMSLTHHRMVCVLMKPSLLKEHSHASKSIAV